MNKHEIEKSVCFQSLFFIIVPVGYEKIMKFLRYFVMLSVMSRKFRLYWRKLRFISHSFASIRESYELYRKS